MEHAKIRKGRYLIIAIGGYRCYYFHLFLGGEFCNLACVSHLPQIAAANGPFHSVNQNTANRHISCLLQ